MFPQIFSLLLLLIVCFIEKSSQKQHFYIQQDSCIAQEFSKNCQANCSISKSNRNNTLTAFINVLNDSEKYGASMKLMGKSSGKDFQFFDGSSDDVCPNNGKIEKYNMLTILLNDMKRVGNFPDCPMDKGVYFLKDFNFNVEHLPPYVPELKYELDFGLHIYSSNGKRQNCVKFIVKGLLHSYKNPFDKKPKLGKI